MIWAKIDRAISSGVRAPMSRPAGVWTRSFRPSSMSSESSTARPRFGLAMSPTYGIPADSASTSACSSSKPCDATTTASVVRIPASDQVTTS